LEDKKYKFAIIGVGPRGSYALECLLFALARLDNASDFRILLFEDSSLLGGGPVYRQDQPDTNWINITERALDLPARLAIKINGIVVPRFPGYHEWSNLVFDTWPENRPDSFPPRAKIGLYLNERYNSLTAPLVRAGLIHLVAECVVNIDLKGNSCILTTVSKEKYSAQDVLLTVGHQPTEADDQIAHWLDVSKTCPQLSLHMVPYPIRDLISNVSTIGPNNIAIRGYGLAMMDVARAFGETYGKFNTSDGGTGPITYELSNTEFCLAPFSLDGLAMAPKPYTPLIDAPYVPRDENLNALSVALHDKRSQIEATGSDFLIGRMVPIIAEVFQSLPRAMSPIVITDQLIEDIASQLLRNPDFEHTLLMPRNVHPFETLQSLIDMAMGKSDIYLDYCAGQVWRHCQPTIYAALSHSELHDDVLAEIIALDERLKRYSFGPPVESLQQLLAMYEAGVLNLDVLHNPEISLDDEGWTLKTESCKFVADTMINSVLDGPKILEITSPLLKNLLDKELIQPAHDKLGVLTDSAGYIKSGRDNEFVPIAILGRIAKGTVIGVDAILECFGERPMVWAKSAVEKMSQVTSDGS